MTDIIARLEAAERGSRELSAEVCEVAGATFYQRSLGKAVFRHPKAYESALLSNDLWVTTSFDAALVLLPEGVEYSVTNLHGVAVAEVGLNHVDGPETCRRKDGNIVLAFLVAILMLREREAANG